MNELIRKALEEHFNDYKSYHIWILIGFTFLNVFQSIWISQRLEKFKNQLKKSEIKFSKYSELQTNALRSIYHLLCEFHRANSLLFHSKLDKIGHDKYKYLLKNWLDKYYSVANELAKERILLTPELTKTVTNSIEVFDSVKSIVHLERKNLLDFEEENSGSFEYMYAFEDEEIKAISKALDKIKKEEVIKNSNNIIRELRSKIEEHFLKIND